MGGIYLDSNIEISKSFNELPSYIDIFFPCIKINNSEELKTYLKQIYEKVGLDPNEIQKASLAEPRESGPNGEGRIFHISLTNLEGGGGGSIAYIGGGEAIEV